MFGTQRTVVRDDHDTGSLIGEIERNTPDAVKAERAHARHSIRARAVIEPASMSHRDGHRVEGVTGDVSTGGALLLTSRPLRVGDVYLVTIDRDTLDVAPAYALCLRARQVRPGAFEAGIKFLSPIELPPAPATSTDDLI